MQNLVVTLTPAERLILESYRQLVDGLSDYLGDSFEISLHTLESLDHSIIKLVNGVYTGRETGGPITDFALNMLNKVNTEDGVRSVSYFCENQKGEPLKAVTIAIAGENNRCIGLLCIYFGLNTPLFKLIDFVMPDYSQSHRRLDASISENFTDNMEDIVLSMFEPAKREIYANDAIPASYKNKEVVNALYNRGVFHLKDSVTRVAELLNISKNTVYLHLRNLQKGKQ